MKFELPLPFSASATIMLCSNRNTCLGSNIRSAPSADPMPEFVFFASFFLFELLLRFGDPSEKNLKTAALFRQYQHIYPPSSIFEPPGLNNLICGRNYTSLAKSVNKINNLHIIMSLAISIFKDIRKTYPADCRKIADSHNSIGFERKENVNKN